VAGGLHVGKGEVVGRLWAKNPKPSVHGLVLGVSCETTVQGCREVVGGGKDEHESG
jgi:hypothetical protein